jgi:hypothetical protein
VLISPPLLIGATRLLAVFCPYWARSGVARAVENALQLLKTVVTSAFTTGQIAQK